MMEETYKEKVIIGAAILISASIGLIVGIGLSSEFAKIPAPIATISAAIIVPSIGILGYLVQKRVDRAEQTRNRHFDIHVEMAESIGKLAAAHISIKNMEADAAVAKSEADKAFAISKLKYSVVASDAAIRRLGDLNNIFSGAASGESLGADKAVVEFLRTARVENLGSTELQDKELLASSPFSVSEGN